MAVGLSVQKTTEQGQQRIGWPPTRRPLTWAWGQGARCGVCKLLPCARMISIRFEGTLSALAGYPASTPLAERDSISECKTARARAGTAQAARDGFSRNGCACCVACGWPGRWLALFPYGTGWRCGGDVNFGSNL